MFLKVVMTTCNIWFRHWEHTFLFGIKDLIVQSPFRLPALCKWCFARHMLTRCTPDCGRPRHTEPKGLIEDTADDRQITVGITGHILVIIVAPLNPTL